MAQYVAMGMVFLDGDAVGQNDTWAETQVEWLKNRAETLAAQSIRMSPGTATERSSHFGAYLVEPDNTLILIEGWYIDESGQVVQGMPNNLENP